MGEKGACEGRVQRKPVSQLKGASGDNLRSAWGKDHGGRKRKSGEWREFGEEEMKNRVVAEPQIQSEAKL